MQTATSYRAWFDNSKQPLQLRFDRIVERHTARTGARPWLVLVNAAQVASITPPDGVIIAGVGHVALDTFYVAEADGRVL